MADEIKQCGGQAQCWQLDTTDEQAIQRVFAEVADAFGHLDILVNNAGGGRRQHH
jgi:NAD(P)-dependent dehydrogenase (short-subunit alcohol dehydrogenase family)